MKLKSLFIRFRNERIRKKNREKCIKNIIKAQNVDVNTANDIYKKAWRMFHISAEEFYNHQFYKLSYDEQVKKHQYLVSKKLIKHCSLRHKAYFSGVYANGWTYTQAKEDVKNAIENYGIDLKEYLINDFCEANSSERVSLTNRILNERKLMEESEKQHAIDSKEKKEKCLARVMEHSGWTREEAIRNMDKAREKTGADYEYYSQCRFWELTEEQQQTFFTCGVSRRISEKYSMDQVDTRRMFYYKDLFCKNFSDCFGRNWISTVNLNYKKFVSTFENDNTILYKPRTGVGGHGIIFFELNCEEDYIKAYNEIMNLPFGVLESFLVQHPKMQQLSLNSVNTCRIVTIRTNNPNKGIDVGKVHFCYAGVRMSSSNNRVDNLHSGGMIAAVDLETGKITTIASNHLNEVYEVHPETGVTFIGFEIPFFKEALDMIARKIKELDLEGYYGWDVAITESGPVLIEANNNPGADCLQTPYNPFHIGMKHIMAKFL